MFQLNIRAYTESPSLAVSTKKILLKLLFLFFKISSSTLNSVTKQIQRWHTQRSTKTKNFAVLEATGGPRTSSGWTTGPWWTVRAENKTVFSGARIWPSGSLWTSHRSGWPTPRECWRSFRWSRPWRVPEGPEIPWPRPEVHIQTCRRPKSKGSSVNIQSFAITQQEVELYRYNLIADQADFLITYHVWWLKSSVLMQIFFAWVKLEL